MTIEIPLHSEFSASGTDNSAEKRDALSPTIEAIEAILPLVAAAKPRFAPELNDAWRSACGALQQTWQQRRDSDESHEALHQAMWRLYECALQTNDPDCLAIGEALSSAIDRLENLRFDNPAILPLLAAISATLEALCVEEGLEHGAFSERCQHFAPRLNQACKQLDYRGRSAAIDSLFVHDARERLLLLEEALTPLPPDTQTLLESADWFVQESLQIELTTMQDEARRFLRHVEMLAKQPTNELARFQVVNALPYLAQRVEEVKAAIDRGR